MEQRELQPSGDGGRVQEVKYTPEQVQGAFEWSFTVFENTPEDKLTKKQIAARDLVREVKQKTVDQGKINTIRIIKE